jgi:N-acetyl sugar amidotransferase
MTVSRPYQQCVRCVMDTSDPEILFDPEGRCNHCTEFLSVRLRLSYSGARSESALEQTVGRIRAAGRGRRYDCIVGISGGADSCYAAHIAKKLGLRPLAVHMDNGWNSDIATRNIKRVADGLKIDYASHVLDWNEFRDLQLAFLKASVPEIETPTDTAIPAALHKVAVQHHVHYIISGGNYATEGILPSAWHYDCKDTKYLKAIHSRFGSGRLRTFPTFGYLAQSYYKLVRDVRFLYLLNFVPYKKKEAIALLKREYGWVDYSGKHHESRFTRFVQSYVLPTKFNIDYRRATLSVQICTGEITREDAVDALAKPPYDSVQIENEKEYVAKKFGISRAELDETLALPPRSFTDYPNDQRRLELIYDLYRRFLASRWSISAG